MAALESPVAEAPPEHNEPLTRVRVLEGSFATEHARLVYSGAKNEVIDLPVSLAKKLLRNGMVEAVPSSTPLHRHPVQWR